MQRLPQTQSRVPQRREVALLLQQILQIVAEHEPVCDSQYEDQQNNHPPAASSQESDLSSEVVLDLQLRGERYTLVRSCSATHYRDKVYENDDVLQNSEKQAIEEDEKVHLSPREQEIVRLVAKGHPNKTIAGVLEISPWTVGTHLRRIFAKLKVSSRAEMVASVLRTGLVRNVD